MNEHSLPQAGQVTAVTDSLRGKSDFDLSTSVTEATAPTGGSETKGTATMEPSKSVTVLKRTLDIAVGLAGTAVFAIAYPILALLIKSESPGPALYSQARVGMDKRSRSGRNADSRRLADVGGRIFTIRKFRTMRLDAEANGPQLCVKGHDPRVTRIGRFLRSTHLDELPQFLNVLMGEMSFIGPRPERPHFTVRYFDEIPLYRERTRFAKPGITGLSQIVLGYDDSLESVVRKTRFDLAYRSSLSSLGSWLRIEAWVIANTVNYLFRRGPLSEVAGRPDLAGLDLTGRAHADSLGNPQPAVIRHRGNYLPTMVLAKAVPEPKQPVAAPARIANFFTVDVECWFHAHNLAIPRSAWEGSETRVVANVRRIVDLLAAHRAKGTFFILGWVADRFPEAVRMIDVAGHEIATHGYHHDKVTDMTPYEFEKDLDRSLNSLARLTGQKIIGHRASNFSIVESTMWALEIMTRYGIEYDSSIFPVKQKRYGISDYPNRMPHVIDLGGGNSIREIPLSVEDFGGKTFPIAGGGYLRLYPGALTEMHIRRRNRLGQPAMVYFHPWELDLEQPRINVGPVKTFQHYVNLGSTERKLDRLLEKFSFASVGEILETERVQTMLARSTVTAKIPSLPESPDAPPYFGNVPGNPGRSSQEGMLTA